MAPRTRRQSARLEARVEASEPAEASGASSHGRTAGGSERARLLTGPSGRGVVARAALKLGAGLGFYMLQPWETAIFVAFFALLAATGGLALRSVYAAAQAMLVPPR